MHLSSPQGPGSTSGGVSACIQSWWHLGWERGRHHGGSSRAGDGAGMASAGVTLRLGWALEEHHQYQIIHLKLALSAGRGRALSWVNKSSSPPCHGSAARWACAPLPFSSAKAWLLLLLKLGSIPSRFLGLPCRGKGWHSSCPETGTCCWRRAESTALDRVVVITSQ